MKLLTPLGFSDAVVGLITRGRGAAESLRIGPNIVHVTITHADGRVTDLGYSKNLITNGGKDHVARILGGKAGFGIISTIATAADATSITGTTTPFVASAHIGQIVIAENGTNAPVWGNIVSNTTGVLTIDSWKYGDGSAGATPAATANFGVHPGGAPATYMAITENATAASATDTALTGEITTGGAARKLATYAHTDGTSTFTWTAVFTITATFPAIQKMGMFPHLAASTGPMTFESVFSAASVISGDTLTVVDTVTLS